MTDRETTGPRKTGSARHRMLLLKNVPPDLKAVYKTGKGTMGRGHWEACVGTWDLGTRVEGRGDVWTRGRQI